MAANDGDTIQSIEELRKRVPAILKRLSSDQALLLGAAANPILALEELGYNIPDTLRRELDQRIRFSSDDRARLLALSEQLNRIAGEKFDPDDAEVLEHLLFTRLELPPLPPEPVRVEIPPDESTGGQGRRSRPAEQRKEQKDDNPNKPVPEPARPITPRPTIPRHRLEVRYAPPGTTREPDELEPLLGRHPIIEPLLEYRAIAARHAPFAPRELYERIRRGDVPGPTLKLRARLHRARPE